MTPQEHDTIALALSQLMAEHLQDLYPQASEEDRLLESIKILGQMSAESSLLQHEAVRAARETGISWAAIGTVLGTSRQAVQQRFSATSTPEPAVNSRIIGYVSRADELDALTAAGRDGWKLVSSRHGEHTVAHTDTPWEVCRASMFALTGFPSSKEGWEAASTRFPDCFFLRPLTD